MITRKFGGHTVEISPYEDSDDHVEAWAGIEKIFAGKTPRKKIEAAINNYYALRAVLTGLPKQNELRDLFKAVRRAAEELEQAMAALPDYEQIFGSGGVDYRPAPAAIIEDVDLTLAFLKEDKGGRRRADPAFRHLVNQLAGYYELADKKFEGDKFYGFVVWVLILANEDTDAAGHGSQVVDRLIAQRNSSITT